MSVHVQYMVSCAGGGWLVPGRPLICHGVATKFTSADDAHRSAVAAGWSYDRGSGTHRCPRHQPVTSPVGRATGHVHYFVPLASYPMGPEETGTLRQCACGEQRETET